VLFLLAVVSIATTLRDSILTGNSSSGESRPIILETQETFFIYFKAQSKISQTLLKNQNLIVVVDRDYFSFNWQTKRQVSLLLFPSYIYLRIEKYTLSRIEE